MSPFILLILVLLIGTGIYGYMMYRTNAERPAREQKRNQFHYRVLRDALPFGSPFMQEAFNMNGISGEALQFLIGRGVLPDRSRVCL